MAVCMIPNCRKTAPSDDPFCVDHRDVNLKDEIKRLSRELAATRREALQPVKNVTVTPAHWIPDEPKP